MKNNLIERRTAKEQYIFDHKEEIEYWLTQDERYYNHRSSPLRNYVESTIMPALQFSPTTYWKDVWLGIKKYYKQLQKRNAWKERK